MARKRQRAGKEVATEGSLAPRKVIWTHEEKLTLEKFEKVIVHPTRFMDRDVVAKMGIIHDVEELLTNMGVGCLINMDYPTYEEETKQFLSTLRVEYENKKEKVASEGMITFKVGKMGYGLSINDICEAYGFQKREAVKFTPFKARDDFWNTIANGRYMSHRAKMTMVKNPVIRYVCKLLANTFFARKEAGAVTMTELSIVYMGLRHLYEGPFGREYDDGVNYGSVFATELEFWQKWGCKEDRQRDLYIGGMLTPLFEMAGVDLSKSTPIPRKNYVDKEYLTGSWFLKGKTDPTTFHYRVQTRHKLIRTFVLPQVGKTNIITLDNVMFDLGEDEFLEQGRREIVLYEDKEEDEQQRDDLEELNKMELPDIDFPIKTPRESLLHQAYKAQKKINELQKKLITKLFKEIKKLKNPQCISSEEEAEDEEEEARNE